jgi:perosamine synthetase
MNIPIAKPCFSEEEETAAAQVLRSGWLTQGEKVEEFEEKFAVMHQTKYAVATSSGTAALHLILLAIGIGPGDEVIVPSYSWVATANTVVLCGATPVFADISLDDFNIETSSILHMITKKTKAIIVVHLFGLMTDVSELYKVIPKEILIIEDAACAAGASLDMRMAGSMSTAGAFSFHPRKLITTGEGGMITTDSSEIFHLARSLRNHGIASKFSQIASKTIRNLPQVESVGLNYRLTDLQAAIGLVQLSKLSGFIQERNLVATKLRSGLKDVEDLSLPNPNMNVIHAFQAFVVMFKGKHGRERASQLHKHLESRGIETRPGTQAIHLLDYYKKHTFKGFNLLPNTEKAFYQSLALPLFNGMKDEQIFHVIDTVRSFD